MTPTLEAKLVELVGHVSQCRGADTPLDTLAVDSLLDDPEVAEWRNQARRRYPLQTRFRTPKRGPAG